MYLISFLATLVALSGTAHVLAQTFKPAEYSKKTAICKALNRDTDTWIDIKLRMYSTDIMTTFRF
jgi:hypothetical protein